MINISHHVRESSVEDRQERHLRQGCPTARKGRVLMTVTDGDMRLTFGCDKKDTAFWIWSSRNAGAALLD